MSIVKTPSCLFLLAFNWRDRFSLESAQRVRQKTCESLREFAARTKLRADSTLILLPDLEFEACQTALESRLSISARSSAQRRRRSGNYAGTDSDVAIPFGQGIAGPLYDRRSFRNARNRPLDIELGAVFYGEDNVSAPLPSGRLLKVHNSE